MFIVTYLTLSGGSHLRKAADGYKVHKMRVSLALNKPTQSLLNINSIHIIVIEIWFYYFHKPKSTDFKLFYKSDDQMEMDMKALSKLLCTCFLNKVLFKNNLHKKIWQRRDKIINNKTKCRKPRKRPEN